MPPRSQQAEPTMTDEQIDRLFKEHKDFGEDGMGIVGARMFARAVEQASRRVALEEAAKECDELEALALEDMALEKDERFGVYAKKYRLAAKRIRALADGDTDRANR
jgi:hypothetical protein